MTQSSRTSAWRERVEALKNVPPVLRMLWDSGRAVVVWGVVLRLAVSALPLAITYVAAWILGGVQGAISHQGLPRYFWWAVLLEVGLAVLSNLLNRLIDFFDNVMADRYTQYVSIMVMEKAARSGSDHLRRSGFL